MDLSSESELLARAKAGDDQAFAQVLVPYLPMLFAYSRAICGDYHTAQDVVQDTALIAYRNLHHLFPEADFSTWLRAIARRQALSARRSANKLNLVADETLEAAYQDPEPAGWGPQQEALAHCLRILGGRMGQVLQAHYFEGSRLADVAAGMEMNVSAVKQLLYRARLWLHQCVQKRLGLEDA
jgi:RNA polymerase sigma-70 factor (ECF subfamily)